MDDDAWTATAVAGGMPRPAAEFALTMSAASRAGGFEAADPALEAVIGRPAKTVQEDLRETPEGVTRSWRRSGEATADPRRAPHRLPVIRRAADGPRHRLDTISS